MKASPLNPNIYLDPITVKLNYQIQPRLMKQISFQTAGFVLSNNRLLYQRAHVSLINFKQFPVVRFSQKQTKRSESSLANLLAYSIQLLPASREELARNINAPKRRLAAALYPLIELQILVEKDALAIYERRIIRYHQSGAQIVVNPVQLAFMQNYGQMFEYYSELCQLYSRLQKIQEEQRVVEEPINNEIAVQYLMILNSDGHWTPSDPKLS